MNTYLPASIPRMLEPPDCLGLQSTDTFHNLLFEGWKFAMFAWRKNADDFWKKGRQKPQQNVKTPIS